jgi:hypothetical protein
MPTKIQKFECATCYDVHDELGRAEDCCRLVEKDPSCEPVIVLDLYECDGCQETYDSESYAEQCEADHETADAEGKTANPEGRTARLVDEVGQGLCSMGLTQAGNMFRKAARRR